MGRNPTSKFLCGHWLGDNIALHDVAMISPQPCKFFLGFGPLCDNRQSQFLTQQNGGADNRCISKMLVNTAHENAVNLQSVIPHLILLFSVLDGDRPF